MTASSINCCKPAEGWVGLRPGCNWRGQERRLRVKMGKGEGACGAVVLPLAREFPGAVGAVERLARPPAVGQRGARISGLTKKRSEAMAQRSARGSANG